MVTPATSSASDRSHPSHDESSDEELSDDEDDELPDDEEEEEDEDDGDRGRARLAVRSASLDLPLFESTVSWRPRAERRAGLSPLLVDAERGWDFSPLAWLRPRASRCSSVALCLVPPSLREP